MKQPLKLATIVAFGLLSISLISCGGREQPGTAKLKPEKTAIAGDLSDYVALEDQQYEMTGDYIGHLAVKVKSLKPLNATYDQVELKASLLSGDGMPISGIAVCNLDLDSRTKLANLLKRGNGEEILSFDAFGWNTEIADKAKKFSVSSEYNEASASSGVTTSNSQNSALGSSEIDAALDEYEKLTDDYVKMIEGMNADNTSDMLQGYTAALVRTQEVGEKLETAKSELTSKQVARMINIQSKLTKAMAKIPQKK